MAIVMSKNFGGTIGQAYTGDEVFSAAGTPSVVAGPYGKAVRIPAGTQTWLGQASFTGTTARVFSRIYRLSAAPTTRGQIFTIRTASASVAMACINTAGKLEVAGTSKNSPLKAATTALPLNTWFRVVYILNGTSWQAVIYPDTSSTTPAETISGTITSASATLTREGPYDVVTGMPGADLDIAWPVDDDSGDPGLRVYVSVVLDVTLGVVPKTVTAAAAVTNPPAGTQAWTFDWGDGDTTGPQSSPEAEHEYTEPGAHQVTATLEVS